ncbi:MAG: hypothetical protein MRY83_10490 [Flavobacteriales bacterium]|nr:hypothetical protein [Flavobacteriales bacterium]
MKRLYSNILFFLAAIFITFGGLAQIMHWPGGTASIFIGLALGALWMSKDYIFKLIKIDKDQSNEMLLDEDLDME